MKKKVTKEEANEMLLNDLSNVPPKSLPFIDLLRETARKERIREMEKDKWYTTSYNTNGIIPDKYPNRHDTLFKN